MSESYSKLAAIVTNRISQLEKNPCRTDDLREQWAKLVILTLPTSNEAGSVNACQTCDHFRPARIHNGVGLRCLAKLSPKNLAEPIVGDIDFCQSSKSIKPIVDAKMQTEEIQCPGYKH
jgi:hypothetical protein